MAWRETRSERDVAEPVPVWVRSKQSFGTLEANGWALQAMDDEDGAVNSVGRTWRTASRRASSRRDQYVSQAEAVSARSPSKTRNQLVMGVKM